jgi:SAM-dependent methyltransferase
MSGKPVPVTGGAGFIGSHIVDGLLESSDVEVRVTDANPRLNLGCGPHAPAGWVNVDSALGARLAHLPRVSKWAHALGLVRLEWPRGIVTHDLRRRFPWPDESVAVVYSSHTLEHLSREEGRRFLSEARRVLVGGGVIRIVVPDLARVIAEYTSGRLGAERFVEALNVLPCDERDGAFKRRTAPLVRFPHKCMYDEKALVATMTACGFDAQVRAPFESAIHDVHVVEIESRVCEAVIVEGVKKRMARNPGKRP